MKRQNTLLPAEIFFSRSADFLNVFLPKQLARSPHTVETYRDALTIFHRFIRDEAGFSITTFQYEDCTRELMLSFIEHMRKSCKESTINNRLAALKSYMGYVSDDNVLVASQLSGAMRVPFVKEPAVFREILDNDAVSAILQAPPNTKIGTRDRVILILLYDTAIRVDELIGIFLRDIQCDTDPPTIIIHGKGDKYRSVMMNKQTKQHVEAYLQIFHKGGHDGAPLIYTRIKGTTAPMSPGNVERIVQKYAYIARTANPDLNIPEKVYPHMLRRSRASGLYRNGVPLEMIARILGHSSTEVTKRYAIPSDEMLSAAMAQDSFETNEAPLWDDSDATLARLCGIR